MTTVADATAQRRNDALSPAARRAIFGAWLGFFVDQFDIYLPVIALAPAAIYFQPKNLDPALAATIYFSIFAATLIGRPVGAVIFGNFADTIGRKQSAMIAVGGFGVITFLIAILPGYQNWGLTVLLILILLRFIDGVFLGGEYTAASPLAMEYAPRSKRGLVGALIQVGYPCAYVGISLITLFMLGILSAKGLNSPYVQWGWRIPFFAGSLLALAFVIYYHFFVPESELWEKSKEAAASGSEKTEAPLKQLFRGDNLRSLVQVFVLMTGVWLTLQSVLSTLPAVLIQQKKLPPTTATTGLLIANVLLAFGYIGAGLLSQRVGRRLLFIAYGVLSATVAPVLYVMLVDSPGTVTPLVLAAIVTVLVISVWGFVTTYITERFHTGVRASGYGVGYSLAVILPALYAYYMLGLGNFIPYKYTQIVLLAIGGLFIIVGAVIGPETKDLDFASEVTRPEAESEALARREPAARPAREPA
jgi:MFS family permease